MPDERDSNEIIRIRTNAVAPATDPVAGVSGFDIWGRIHLARIEEGLSTAQVAKRAGVPVFAVEAIETGAVERLPVGDAGRREIAAVCRALQLDPDPFVEAQRTQLRSPPLSDGLGRMQPLAGRTRFVVLGIVWVVLVGIVLLSALFGWFGAGEPRGEAPTSVTRTTLAAPTTAAPTTTAPLPPVRYEVTVTAGADDAELRVTVDDEAPETVVLGDGESRTFRGDRLRFVFSDPDDFAVVVNGDPVGFKRVEVYD